MEERLGKWISDKGSSKQPRNYYVHTHTQAAEHMHVSVHGLPSMEWKSWGGRQERREGEGGRRWKGEEVQKKDL